MTVFVNDPCGIICITFTYAALLYADYVIIKWVVMQTMIDSLWAPVHVVLFNTLIFLLSFAHLKATCSDPGVVPLPQTKIDFSDMHSGTEGLLQKENWTVCTRCETYRPPRAHHCRICKRCIRHMDHHCPWINNCVGERNQQYFVQFLMYVGVLSLYAIVLVAFSWIKECTYCSEEISIKQTRILHCVILVMESTLFGIFVTAILYDQLEAIAKNQTTIEQLQSGSSSSNSMRRMCFSQLCRFPCEYSPLSNSSSSSSLRSLRNSTNKSLSSDIV